MRVNARGPCTASHRYQDGGEQWAPGLRSALRVKRPRQRLSFTTFPLPYVRGILLVGGGAGSLRRLQNRRSSLSNRPHRQSSGIDSCQGFSLSTLARIHD